MGYVGEKLATLCHPEPLEISIRLMADEGAEDFQNWVERNTPVEFGTLRKSWYLTPMDRMPASASPGRIALGTAYVSWLRTEVDYAAHVEWGTGIYGPSGSPYPITPKEPGGTLTWVDPATGRRIYAARVEHPGSPGQHMMAIGAAMAEHHLRRLIKRHVHAWTVAQEALAR